MIGCTVNAVVLDLGVIAPNVSIRPTPVRHGTADKVRHYMGGII